MAISLFSAAVIRDLFYFHRNRSINVDVLVKQILFSGVQAMGLCMLISLLFGALIIVEGYQLLTAIGQTN
jgi:phospholipid/cholesterol/gamma-HCH transport system permease protein